MLSWSLTSKAALAMRELRGGLGVSAKSGSSISSPVFTILFFNKLFVPTTPLPWPLTHYQNKSENPTNDCATFSESPLQLLRWLSRTLHWWARSVHCGGDPGTSSVHCWSQCTEVNCRALHWACTQLALALAQLEHWGAVHAQLHVHALQWSAQQSTFGRRWSRWQKQTKNTHNYHHGEKKLRFVQNKKAFTTSIQSLTRGHRHKFDTEYISGTQVD